MARNADSFGRSGLRYRPQPTTLVICEDSKSGVQYLQEASRYFRAHAKVEVTHCGRTDPKGIVEEALSRQDKFDHVYCVIDRDAHENFNEAIDLAKSSTKITVIASYPCFEYWLLLHYKKSRKPYAPSGRNSSADNLVKELRKCAGMEEYEKGNAKRLFELLLGEKFVKARKNSPLLLAEAINEGDLNPSTAIHSLIDALESLSVPQQIS